jgi:hypothetical protein
MRLLVQQAASVRATARAFSLPYRHVRHAVTSGELHTFGSGQGRAAILLFEDVRAWLQRNPTQRKIGDSNDTRVR